MKKSLLLVAVMALSMASYGQFRVGLGLIGGIPSGSFGDITDFGIGGYIEPKVSLNDLEVGVHLGGMAFAGANIDTGAGSVGLSATTVIPILAIGQYYLDVPGVTPYFGLGLGPYIVDGGSASGSAGGGTFTADVESTTKFGVAPKIGINIGGFDIGAAYHIVSDLNFLAINLGFHIGKRAG